MHMKNMSLFRQFSGKKTPNILKSDQIQSTVSWISFEVILGNKNTRCNWDTVFVRVVQGSKFQTEVYCLLKSNSVFNEKNSED